MPLRQHARQSMSVWHCQSGFKMAAIDLPNVGISIVKVFSYVMKGPGTNQTKKLISKVMRAKYWKSAGFRLP